MKLKPLFTHWRVIMLLIFLVFALIAIHPQLFGTEGVAIRSVVPNSSAALAGIQNPAAQSTPLQKERVVALAGQDVHSIEEYYLQLEQLQSNQTVRLETNRQIYTLTTKETPAGTVDLGLKVSTAPTTNLRKGLDLEGGTRVLLKATDTISTEDLQLTIDNLKERLNVYGLSDVVVRSASDMEGQDFILIEIAGVTEEEVKELLAKQGKFEATVANTTVFYGGKKDVTYVCRTADCSGLDPRQGCSQYSDGYACRFFFSITLSSEAAERQAEATGKLSVINDESGYYLSDYLVLYLDDKEVDHLRIGAELKGKASTEIQISGSGTGINQQEAAATALLNMKKLQTVLITGSLPTKLEIVKLDTISPSLGREFLQNIMLVGILVLLGVSSVVGIRYRRAKIVIPMVLTLISEVVLILGFAALVGWNLDLAAIAGILIVAGTGVDQLIIITDETLRGEVLSDWKSKIKNAMFIVIGAYLTNLASMLPLWFIGAGLLKGFAFTTIVGLSFGVLVARPAYAVIIEKLMNNE